MYQKHCEPGCPSTNDTTQLYHISMRVEYISSNVDIADCLFPQNKWYCYHWSVWPNIESDLIVVFRATSGYSTEKYGY